MIPLIPLILMKPEGLWTCFVLSAGRRVSRIQSIGTLSKQGTP